MKRVLGAFTGAILFASFAAAAVSMPLTVSFNSIPSTVEEFVTLRDQLAVTPTGGATMFVIAMMNYEKDEALGLKCFTAILVNDSTMLRDDAAGYGGKSPNNNAMYYIQMIKKYSFLPNIYIVGTAAANGYALPAAPYKCMFSTNAYNPATETSVKVFVLTTSGNMPRPIRLEKNNRGIWKVSEFSSLVIGPSNLPPEPEADDGI